MLSPHPAVLSPRPAAGTTALAAIAVAAAGTTALAVIAAAAAAVAVAAAAAAAAAVVSVVAAFAGAGSRVGSHTPGCSGAASRRAAPGWA